MSGGSSGYDVLDKWNGPSFNDVTRAVLGQRLRAVPERRFFTAAEFALLEAVCDRLMPQPTDRPPVPIAAFIDADLHEGASEGFRRPGMPPATDIWRTCLAGIEAAARRNHGCGFIDLDAGAQDALLAMIQAGDAGPDVFAGLPVANVFVGVLLKTVAAVYYSHPLAWSEIGFGGPASPRGYVRIGLNERDPWEAPFASARAP